MKQLLGSIFVTPDGPCDRIQNVNESGIFKDYRFIYRLVFIESRFKTFKWIDINSWLCDSKCQLKFLTFVGLDWSKVDFLA